MTKALKKFLIILSCTLLLSPANFALAISSNPVPASQDFRAEALAPAPKVIVVNSQQSGNIIKAGSLNFYPSISISESRPCMLGVQAGGNLVQDAAGTNLLSQPESCFALSMSEKVLTRTLSVEPLAQSPTAITVLPTAFITVFNPAASFPDSGTIIPHPSLAWAMGSVIAAAVIGLKKQSLYSKAKRRRALTLPQLQVMRC